MNDPAPSVGAASSVGVVIRTRDRALFLERALSAVAAQTYQHWHVMLVNDGGAPGAVDQAQTALRQSGSPFPADRLTIAHLPRSVGRSAAFNHGLHRLDTDLVGCLDDDDTWHPRFMEDLVAFHGKTRLLAADLGGVMALLTALREDIVSAADFGAAGDTDDDTAAAATRTHAAAVAHRRAGTGAADDDVILPLGEDWLAPAFRRKDFFVNPIAYATYRHDLYPVQWLLDRRKVADMGGFPEEFDVMEDRAFMTRFLQHWRLAVLDKPLAFHHRRVRRTVDSGRTVALNTVDNPSYDWRLFADLARTAVHSPPLPAGDGQAGTDTLPGLLRGIAATVVKELNDETSALWHKLNTETGFLRDRLQAIDNRLSGAASAVAPVEADPARVAYSLWRHMDGRQIGHSLEPATPFLDRFTLSQQFSLPGQLVFADAGPQRLEVQLPETRDWSAVEFMLDGLAGPGEGLEIQLILGAAQGYLFETALSVFGRDALGRRKHRFEESHVHSCPDWGTVQVHRRFGPSLLSRAKDPKLSIILPKSAHNFRLICHDLVIMRY
ncbi:MAG: glycosyltransferase family 2 protein [Pararhodobacter sp.]|nr:glycosyltransferase family 2 protein [Pararhodobacter sp.]